MTFYARTLRHWEAQLEHFVRHWHSPLQRTAGNKSTSRSWQIFAARHILDGVHFSVTSVSLLRFVHPPSSPPFGLSQLGFPLLLLVPPRLLFGHSDRAPLGLNRSNTTPIQH